MGDSSQAAAAAKFPQATEESELASVQDLNVASAREVGAFLVDVTPLPGATRLGLATMVLEVGSSSGNSVRRWCWDSLRTG